MDDQLYRDEPIPQRRSSRPSPRTPMNGSKPEAKQIIERILADERFAHVRLPKTVTHAVNDERPAHAHPSIEPTFELEQRTASNLPNRYREMRAISRWEQSTDGKRGRWLSEAELFYRQGKFMEDFEDNCPYEGSFKSYFPTYNAMSDRQLRGYFAWRTAVRSGEIERTSLSYAYVYLYELINGIGVTDPLGGFRTIERFWQAYRAFSPEIDRFAGVWLQDYAVYHNLPAELLEPYKTLAFDRSLIALRRADEQAARYFEMEQMGTAEHLQEPAAAQSPSESLETPQSRTKSRRKKNAASALPLPVRTELEEPLFHAINALSTYRLTGSKLYKEQPAALCHVACAVFVRMSAYHRKHRKGTLLESWFGEEVALPYTMFGSAVFFAEKEHEDCVYELDEIHRYRCSRGYWTCERHHGSRSKSPKLGSMMHAVDRSLREALEFEHPLKKMDKTPKYLQKFIDQEIEIWLSWSEAHAPRRIDIDLSQLAGIRFAAEATRESLLIDEERDGRGGAMLDAAIPDEGTTGRKAGSEVMISATTPLPECAETPAELTGCIDVPAKLNEHMYTHMDTSPKPSSSTGSFDGKDSALERGKPVDVAPTLMQPLGAATELNSPLTCDQRAYIQALYEGDETAQKEALRTSDMSEDMLVDAINEALFDLIGDTVIEYGSEGPELIEDYRSDVEGFIDHAQCA
ncbi:TerB N-terminal domain-containing protein [Collinsella provencensis]|uniref:TerB N-terminal domain-containing protein n=1 Tax=Collinsella provencensis TaxID=1937461 RepID=UPI000C831346|nr:TerB N-terminal domain-containing protein [Collinsella provencensis]